MSKKTILIIIVVFAVVGWIVIDAVTTPAPPEYGNTFNGMSPKVESPSEANIKGVKFICDESGSMKGFVDFSGLNAKAKNNMVGTVSSVINKVAEKYPDTDEFYAVCGTKRYNNIENFVSELRSNKAFTNNSSYLWELVEEGVEYASDTTVSIILSDMVLSYGRNAIIENKDLLYNPHQLDGLKGEIITQMRKAKEKKSEVVVVQYESGFNGHFYCNCQENLTNLTPQKEEKEYDGQMMEQRPYYIMFIGSKANLKSLISHGCYADCKNMYASFVDPEVALADTEYLVEAKNSDVWQVGSYDEKPGGFYNQFKPNESTSFEISCSQFTLPRYYYKDGKSFEAICDGPANVSDLNYADNTIRMNLTTESVFDSFTKDGEGSFIVDIFATNNWIADSSCDDDINKLDEIKGRTWGLKALFDGIDEVYQAKTITKVGSITINYYIAD